MDTTSVDIMGKRIDGGVDLVIVLEKTIDDLPEEQSQLLEKIENYMAYASGREFADEFPGVSIKDVTIQLSIPGNPSDKFITWVKEINTWVIENGFGFSVIIR